MSSAKKPLVIGIGNLFRKDDRAGLWIVRQLKNKNLPGISLQESSGEITDLMELWRDYPDVIAVDALSSGKNPGEILRFEVHKAPLPAETFQYSTHGLSLAEAVELARAMGQLPGRFIIYAIEGKDFSAGEGMTAEVEGGCRKVIKRILQDLNIDGEDGDHA